MKFFKSNKMIIYKVKMSNTQPQEIQPQEIQPQEQLIYYTKFEGEVQVKKQIQPQQDLSSQFSYYTNLKEQVERRRVLIEEETKKDNSMSNFKCNPNGRVSVGLNIDELIERIEYECDLIRKYDEGINEYVLK
jgi:hypothetical protein